MKSPWLRRLTEINGELWLILSLFLIAMLLNYMVSMHRAVLGFYFFPTIFSAYFYGRRHATMTALLSFFLVITLTSFNPGLFASHGGQSLADSKWFDIILWGGTLMVTAYAMGTLYDRNQAKLRELRQTYHGVLLILRQFISKDKYTQNHSYRVSIYAAKIASALRFSEERIEDVRAAALLHDIGKLDISRDLLYKAARLTSEETEEVKLHIEKGGEILHPVGGALHRILPIVLAHHDNFDGSGHHPTRGEDIPLEARIISVADTYDALTSDRPYRKATSPFEAKEIIMKSAGTQFDPDVVRAFDAAFTSGEMEVPELVV
jgi:HD-GYP domain-containing protein (c-di-GMP phosphodiesterase class II)